MDSDRSPSRPAFMYTDISPFWVLREQAVPADLCAHLADRIEWEVANATLPLRGPLATVETNDLQVVQCAWEQVQELVPPHLEGCALVGPHPTARLLQYNALDNVADSDVPHPVHADTPLDAPGAQSCLTALIYVSSKFTGGSVLFFGVGGNNEGAPPVEVQPREGSVLVFDHRVRHCATAVKSGIKRLIKISVLYALAPEGTESVGQISATDRDRDVQVSLLTTALSAVRGAAECTFSAAQAALFGKHWLRTALRPPLADNVFEFVGTAQDKFNELVIRAEQLEQEPQALEEARERLLDFIVLNDLSSWPKEVMARAFMAMILSINTPRLKLRAYQAFNAATQLHDDERCMLLGETLIKDSNDPDPNVRLAAINAVFQLMRGEEYRASVVMSAITRDPCPRVRLRALEGLLALAEDASRHETAEARADSADALLELYEDTLLQVTRGPQCNGAVASALAIQVMNLLSQLTSVRGSRHSAAGRTDTDLQEPPMQSLLD